jgi:hypothetical protein
MAEEVVVCDKPVTYVKSESPGWLAVIEKMIDKGTPESLLTRVFEMQERWDKEQQRKLYVADYAKFKADAPPFIAKTKEVKYPGKGGEVAYWQSELDEATRVLVPHLSRNNLSHSWIPRQDKETGIVYVTCRLSHSAGHCEEVTMFGPPDTSGNKDPLKAVGSTTSYLSRYTFLAITGTAQKGNDHETVSQPAVIYVNEDDQKLLHDMLEQANVEEGLFIEFLQEKIDKEIKTLKHLKQSEMTMCIRHLQMLKNKRKGK